MQQYLDIAVKAARAAGELQRTAYGEPVRVMSETAHDVKLATDVECETLIHGILREAFPDHAFLAEEGGGTMAADRPTWVVDPLDGTVNFSRKLPYFCCSIALYMDGRPVVGAVYQPLLDEMFTAIRGQGAFRNGERICVSPTTELSEAMLAMGFSKLDKYIANMIKELHGLAYQVKKIRIMGAAALDLSYVACGRYDGFLEDGLRTWDIAAGSLLVEEAGGRMQVESHGNHTWNVRAGNGKLL